MDCRAPLFRRGNLLKNNESPITVQRIFHCHFRLGCHDRVPDHRTIVRWANHFRTTASSLNEKSPGHPRSQWTPVRVEEAHQALIRSPHCSAVRHALALGMSPRSLQCIIHDDLKFHPCKIQIVQQLNERNKVARREFGMDFLGRLAAEPKILNNLVMSDEAHFQLSGGVNKQNFQYYASENQRQLHAKPLHSERVTVWCALASFGIIGPYFFKDHNGRTVTVTSDRYVNMVNTVLLPALTSHNRHQIWFQQDGATTHTAHQSMAVLRHAF